MKAIHFKQSNIEIAKEQDEYHTLPAHVDKQGTITTCFKLTLEEVEALVEDGELYLQVMTFGKPLQPLSIHTTNPLETEEK